MPRRVSCEPDFVLLSSLFGDLPSALGVKNADGAYLWANPRLAEIAGVAVEAMLGRSDAELFSPGVAAQFRRYDREALGGGETRPCAEETLVAGVKRCYLWHRFPIRDAGGAVVALGVLATELSEQKRREDEARQAALAAEAINAELRRALAEMETLAAVDRLTGAWNLARLKETAAIEMSRAERYAQPVSLLRLDLDHFQDINDRFGRSVGDALLVAFVNCVRGLIRKADSITRCGSKAFVVLAPNSRLADAARLAEKLRAAIAATEFANVGRLTVSIGIAEYQRGEAFDSWLTRAHRALDQAKADGCNEVVADPATTFGERRRQAPGSSLLQLKWRDVYTSGHPLVDGQHERLFELANRLLESIVSGAGKVATIAIADELIAEMQAHFADEEELQREIGFPGLDAHAEEHAQLLAKTARLRQYVGKGTLAPNDFYQFLAYEVTAQHVLGSDRSYYGHLNRVAVPTTRSS